ncbi:MAG: hypothetical protein ABIH83_05885 [Candidatus Micrarchaeota archaeon]
MSSAPIGKEFVFAMPNGTVVGRAKNLEELIKLVKTAPLESVLYHAKGRHFSPWLEMLGIGKISKRLKSMAINTKTIRVALLRALRS